MEGTAYVQLYARFMEEVVAAYSQGPHKRPKPLMVHRIPGYPRLVRMLRRLKGGRALARALGSDSYEWGSVVRPTVAARAANWGRRHAASFIRCVTRCCKRIAARVDAPVAVPTPVTFEHLQLASSHIAARIELVRDQMPADRPLWAWDLTPQGVYEHFSAQELLTMRLVNKMSRLLSDRNSLWKALCMRELPAVRTGALTLAEAETINEPREHVLFSWRLFYWQMRRLQTALPRVEGECTKSEGLREMPKWLHQKKCLRRWTCIEVIEVIEPSSSSSAVVDASLGSSPSSSVMAGGVRPAGRVWVHTLERPSDETLVAGIIALWKFNLPLPSSLTKLHLRRFSLRVFSQVEGRIVPILQTQPALLTSSSTAKNELHLHMTTPLGGLHGGLPLSVKVRATMPLRPCKHARHPLRQTPVELSELSLSFCDDDDAQHCMQLHKPPFSSRTLFSELEFFKMAAEIDSPFECAVCLEPGLRGAAWTCDCCSNSIHRGCWHRVREVKAACPSCRKRFAPSAEEDEEGSSVEESDGEEDQLEEYGDEDESEDEEDESEEYGETDEEEEVGEDEGEGEVPISGAGYVEAAMSSDTDDEWRANVAAPSQAENEVEHVEVTAMEGGATTWTEVMERRAEVDEEEMHEEEMDDEELDEVDEDEADADEEDRQQATPLLPPPLPPPLPPIVPASSLLAAHRRVDASSTPAGFMTVTSSTPAGFMTATSSTPAGFMTATSSAPAGFMTPTSSAPVAATGSSALAGSSSSHTSWMSSVRAFVWLGQPRRVASEEGEEGDAEEEDAAEGAAVVKADNDKEEEQEEAMGDGEDYVR